MKTNRPSKVKVVVIALLFAAALVLAQPRPAHACLDPFTLGACLVVAVVAVAVTVVAVQAVICTPVAAFKAPDHTNGFTGAYGDCFRPGAPQNTAAATKGDKSSDSIQPAPTQAEPSSQTSTDSVLGETGAEAPAL